MGSLNSFKNFIIAGTRHIINGMPKCTEKEIAARLSICQQCEHFRPRNQERTVGICSHEQCGCNVNAESKLMNKLAWADQVCPIGKWPSLLKQE